jgi:hypothetical protein
MLSLIMLAAVAVLAWLWLRETDRRSGQARRCDVDVDVAAKRMLRAKEALKRLEAEVTA